MKSVAYPGRDGAHSAAACDQLFPSGADLVSLPSFTAVVEATAEGEVAFGVLPIESSLSGPVNETHDLLYESPLSITGETILPIRHCLVGPAAVPLEEIAVVRSHPAALDQCRRLLAHCGLEWEEQVLDFHRSTRASTTASAMQVRRPIYQSSVQKWRNYRRELQPVLRRLAEAGLVDADGNPTR